MSSRTFIPGRLEKAPNGLVAIIDGRALPRCLLLGRGARHHLVVKQAKDIQVSPLRCFVHGKLGTVETQTTLRARDATVGRSLLCNVARAV